MTIRHVYDIATAILNDVASGVIFIGILLVAAAWFAGPARPAYARRVKRSLRSSASRPSRPMGS